MGNVFYSHKEDEHSLTRRQRGATKMNNKSHNDDLITEDDTTTQSLHVEPLQSKGRDRRETFLDAPIPEQYRSPSPTVTGRGRTDTRKGTIFGRKRVNDLPTYKILLLGTGEAGKSTMVKQMKVKFDSGFELDDKKQYKVFIICNVVTALGRACALMKDEGIEFASEGSEKIASRMISLAERQSYLVMNAVKDYDQQMFEQICNLWSDRAVEKVLRENINDLHVCDSVLYFFENLDLMQPPFEIPTETQVMQASRKTTGIVQQYINFADMCLHIVDVGGQRNERKKWRNAFNGVQMVLFVVALSDYDQQLYEDETINRMTESLEVFEQMVNEPSFKDCPFFLIFNKVDSFKHRLEDMMSDLHVCFPEYNLGFDHKAAMNFIQEKYEALYRQKSGNQKLYIEYVNAINSDDMDIFYDKIRDVIQETLTNTDSAASELSPVPKVINFDT